MPDRKPAATGDAPGTGSETPKPESLQTVFYKAFLQQQEQVRGHVDYAGQLAAVLAVQQEITSSEPSLEEVLSLVAKRSVAILGATGAAIAVEHNGAMICRASSGAAGPELGACLSGNTGLSGECLRTGKITICSDSESDPRVDTQAARALGIRSVVVVPLFHHRSIVGIFEVFSARPYFFENEDAHILELLGGLITSAISYCSEFEAKQTLESERTAMLQVLEQIEPTIEKIFVQQPDKTEEVREVGFESEEMLPSATVPPAQHITNVVEMPPAVLRAWGEAGAEKQQFVDADDLPQAGQVPSEQEAAEDEPLPEPPEFRPRRSPPVLPLPSEFSSPPALAAENARQQQVLTSAFEILRSKERLLVPEPGAPLPAPPNDLEVDDLDLPEPEPPPRISVGKGAALQEKSRAMPSPPAIAAAATAQATEAVVPTVPAGPAQVMPTLPSAMAVAPPSPFTGWAKSWGAAVRHWVAGKREPGNAPTATATGTVPAAPAFRLSLRWRNAMEYAIPAVLTGLLIVIGLQWLNSERMVVPFWGHSGALRTPTPSLGGAPMSAATPVEVSSYMSRTAIGLSRSGKNVSAGVKSAVGTGSSAASSDWRGGIAKLGSKLGVVTVTESSLPGKGAPAIAGVQNVVPDVRSSGNSVTLPSNASPGPQAPQEQVTTVRLPEEVLEKFLLFRVQPVYPAIAREKGITGAVVLRTTIARDGTVREVRAVSGNKYLAESALTAISQWRYKPFVLDGKPVQVATEIRVVFKRG